MNPSSRDLIETATAIEGTEVAARQWLQAGLSLGDAEAYVRAGCFDVSRTKELRQAHIALGQIAALGLGLLSGEGATGGSDGQAGAEGRGAVLCQALVKGAGHSRLMIFAVSPFG